MKHFEYCPNCKTKLPALGRVDKITKQKQYHCRKCLVIWVKTKNGLKLKTSFMEPSDQEFESHLPGMVEKDYEIGGK